MLRIFQKATRAAGFKKVFGGVHSAFVRNYYEWSNNNNYLDSWTNHQDLKNWVKDQIAHLQPARVHLCDGSIQEYNEVINLLVSQGSLIKLNEKKLPNSYLARSNKSDVARLEDKTFICSESEKDSGPTNNWKDPQSAMRELEVLFENSMRGRTMYVVPFCMGPLNSKYSKIGIQITDSPYVVACMRIMTRMGISVLKKLGENDDFVPCLHSVGNPLGRNDMESLWPSNETKIVAHFPEQHRIMSFGSGYGGNALMGKKCLALRIASTMGRQDGWLAEHMLIISVTNPQGQKKYFASAFPSACGKTNMAMMQPSLPGWKIECLGDDIAWMHLGKDGRLYAINPEFGFFGVAPGTSVVTNPHMMECIKKDTIYTNVSLAEDFDVWWEGKTKLPPKSLITWLRKEWKSGDAEVETAHANSRFCAPLRNCPILDPRWDDPEGVPIDGIIFGGRRSDVIPLVCQSRDWEHGVFMGSVMSSETTAAAVGKRGLLRIDPFAMRPFCGYNMADYFAHWLSFHDRSANSANLPKMFNVNWFRKQANKFVWPGYGDNIRVLKWIFERCDGKDNFLDSPIGIVPKTDSIDISGLNINKEDMQFLLSINSEEWSSEMVRYKEFYKLFNGKIPKTLVEKLAQLEKAFDKSKND